MRLQLADAPSTGYGWKVIESPEWLVLTADSFEDEIADLPASARSGYDELVGGFIDHVFDFEVGAEAWSARAGLLRLHWLRPWEGVVQRAFAVTLRPSASAISDSAV